MLSTKPTLTPAQVLSRLQSTARTFPTGTGSDCTTSLCGAGIIDGAAAIESPTPAFTSLSPTTATALDAGLILTVNGSNFSPAAVVKWRGFDLTTTYVSATQLTADITAALIVTGGIIPVTVVNPGSVTSDPVNFTLNNPTPTITSISPTSTTAGGADFTLTVNGSNFVNSSVVRWNDTDLTTTFVSTTQLTADIPASDITNAGKNIITVSNSAPGGGISCNLMLLVTFKEGGGSACFIATAAFGTPLEKHVSILREFRDRYLLKTSTGKAFVKFYYDISPPIAGKITQNEGLRFITRCILMPFVGMAYLMITYGVTVTLFSMLFLILMMGALIWTIRRKMMLVNK
jgi:hypothetical protein